MEEEPGCDLSSLCGPVDQRVVQFLQSHWRCVLEPAYLGYVEKWHGGIPLRSYFDAADGKTYRVGRFLTLVDGKSVLESPPQPSWEFPDRDVRIDWSVQTLIDQECATSRNLFYGEALLPFAALYWHTEHPDAMSLTDGNVNLLAFLYNGDDPDTDVPASHPQVVVWLAHKAADEQWRWTEALKENREEEVRCKDFTVPVASNFTAFLRMLRDAP